MENQTVFVIGVRKEIKDNLFLFALEDRDLSRHPDIDNELKKIGLFVSYRNVKLVGPSTSKYYDKEADVFKFNNKALREDVENSFASTNEEGKLIDCLLILFVFTNVL
jgi:hypothetical protein